MVDVTGDLPKAYSAFAWRQLVWTQACLREPLNPVTLTWLKVSYSGSMKSSLLNFCDLYKGHIYFKRYLLICQYKFDYIFQTRVIVYRDSKNKTKNVYPSSVFWKVTYSNFMLSFLNPCKLSYICKLSFRDRGVNVGIFYTHFGNV